MALRRAIIQNTSAQQEKIYTPPAYKSNYTPKKKIEKPIYQEWWFWLIIIAFNVSMIGGMLGGMVGSVSKRFGEQPSETQGVIEEATEKEDEEAKIKERLNESVYSVLKHHIDVEKGAKSEAEAAGAWFAYKLNLSMYRSDNDFQYKAYYYAMYGENQYVIEFGQDDDQLESVKKYIYELLADDIDDIEAITAQQEKRANNDNLVETVDEEGESLTLDEYKAAAIVVSYNDLIREPDKFKGSIIKIKVSILQELVGGIFTESGYRGSASGNEWYISYDLPEGVPRILVNDSVTFYGKFTGLRKMTRAITGTAELVPCLNAQYHE